MSQKADAFRKIQNVLNAVADFDVFLNRVLHNCAGRDWTYGQFLYNYLYEEIQATLDNLKARKGAYTPAERALAGKFFLVKDAIRLGYEKDQKVDVFDDRNKQAFYERLLNPGQYSVRGNPSYWPAAGRVRFLVVEHLLKTQLGLSDAQVRQLVQHCVDKRNQSPKRLPNKLVTCSSRPVDKTIAAFICNVDTLEQEQKQTFMTDGEDKESFFPAGLPIKGENACLWPRTNKARLFAFNYAGQTVKEAIQSFEKANKPTYKYTVDRRKIKKLRAVVPLWGGKPYEYVSPFDLSYTDCEEISLQDLGQKYHKKIYLINNASAWEQVCGNPHLTEQEAEERLQNLTKEGKAIDYFAWKPHPIRKLRHNASKGQHKRIR
ncbi:MAG: hypothetical protein ILP11_00515 [Alphaproteobacteria bacterium]|nr:hypothetical protein [Alphaproteobacteria bacterium]